MIRRLKNVWAVSLYGREVRRLLYYWKVGTLARNRSIGFHATLFTM